MGKILEYAEVGPVPSRKPSDNTAGNTVRTKEGESHGNIPNILNFSMIYLIFGCHKRRAWAWGLQIQPFNL